MLTAKINYDPADMFNPQNRHLANISSTTNCYIHHPPHHGCSSDNGLSKGSQLSKCADQLLLDKGRVSSLSQLSRLLVSLSRSKADLGLEKSDIHLCTPTCLVQYIAMTVSVWIFMEKNSIQVRQISSSNP